MILLQHSLRTHHERLGLLEKESNAKKEAPGKESMLVMKRLEAAIDERNVSTQERLDMIEKRMEKFPILINGGFEKFIHDDKFRNEVSTIAHTTVVRDFEDRMRVAEDEIENLRTRNAALGTTMKQLLETMIGSGILIDAGAAEVPQIEFTPPGSRQAGGKNHPTPDKEAAMHQVQDVVGCKVKLLSAIDMPTMATSLRALQENFQTLQNDLKQKRAPPSSIENGPLETQADVRLSSLTEQSAEEQISALRAQLETTISERISSMADSAGEGKTDDLTSDISVAKSDVAKLKASFDDLHNDINQKVDGFFDVLTSMKESSAELSDVLETKPTFDETKSIAAAVIAHAQAMNAPQSSPTSWAVCIGCNRSVEPTKQNDIPHRVSQTYREHLGVMLVDSRGKGRKNTGKDNSRPTAVPISQQRGKNKRGGALKALLPGDSVAPW